jgi:pyruvate/2-oxoglutarate dehydrogenase complex dihydrolipoamide acyltransferase (E2) component
VIKHDHNFSIAIDSPDGLTVPSIKKVQEKSIIGLNNELLELREKASNGGLTQADFENATFSVSSVGNLGGKYFVPTILRPQAAIIAIGAAYKNARYVEDASHADGYRWEPQDSVSQT